MKEIVSLEELEEIKSILKMIDPNQNIFFKTNEHIVKKETMMIKSRANKLSKVRENSKKS